MKRSKLEQQLYRESERIVPNQLGALKQSIQAMPKPEYVATHRPRKMWWGRLTASLSLVAATAFSIIAFLLPPLTPSVMTEAYVSIDINPSIELLVNPSKIVVHYAATNEDAQVLLLGIDLTGLTLNEATDTILDLATQEGYLDVTTTDNAVMVHTLHNDESFQAEISSEVQTRMQNYMNTNHVFGVVLVGTGKEEMKEDAQTLGVSLGKYYLLQKLKSFDDSLELETLKTMSVKDLKALLSTYDEDELKTRSSYQALIQEIKTMYQAYQIQPSIPLHTSISEQLTTLQAKFGISVLFLNLNMNVIEELELYFDSHAIQSAIQTYTQYQSTRRQAKINAHQIKLEGLNLEQVYATLQATWTQEYRNELIEDYRTNWEEARNRWKSKFNEDHGNNTPGPGSGGGPN